MTVGAIVDLNILLAAETDECGGTVEERASFLTGRVEKHPYCVRVSFIAINKHDRPVSIGTVQRVGSHKSVAVSILDIRGGRLRRQTFT